LVQGYLQPVEADFSYSIFHFVVWILEVGILVLVVFVVVKTLCSFGKVDGLAAGASTAADDVVFVDLLHVVIISFVLILFCSLVSPIVQVSGAVFFRTLWVL